MLPLISTMRKRQFRFKSDMELDLLKGTVATNPFDSEHGDVMDRWEMITFHVRIFSHVRLLKPSTVNYYRKFEVDAFFADNSIVDVNGNASLAKECFHGVVYHIEGVRNSSMSFNCYDYSRTMYFVLGKLDIVPVIGTPWNPVAVGTVRNKISPYIVHSRSLGES